MPILETEHAIFAEACHVIWGRQFHVPAAISLGVAQRTIYRWCDGSNPIPTGIWGDLALWARNQEGKLRTIINAAEVLSRKAT